MATHDNVRRIIDHVLCDKGQLVSNGKVLMCTLDAEWTVDFGPDSVGEHPRCDRHAVQVVKAWTGFETAARKRAKA